ncbi:MAG: hypothetical protein KVP17_005245 [Porospora cf. gigantea B]|uniref:uncharacterized protein n=1 Tax=Porospora cf. gigantea B TaxID=2853592 RepID=UPI003571FAE6|nr:MAG: hypothetical protein KVP17_005245 [Porospora cf. gigantea B]
MFRLCFVLTWLACYVAALAGLVGCDVFEHVAACPGVQPWRLSILYQIVRVASFVPPLDEICLSIYGFVFLHDIVDSVNLLASVTAIVEILLLLGMVLSLVYSTFKLVIRSAFNVACVLVGIRLMLLLVTTAFEKELAFLPDLSRMVDFVLIRFLQTAGTVVLRLQRALLF